ncbi:MAG: GyrI-like domain-containing protein [Flavobacteriaceae bacterium]|nr:GyrI-like domain-containing protein [Flavobacteriaceae bacterium]NNK29015.1 GyrI-like domain-containing protein [Flavobacteriaceae bacterium]
MKSILRFVGILLVALGVWYFFIKDYNYRVTFTSKQSRSIVFDHLVNWHDGRPASDSIVSLVKKQPFHHVVQDYSFGDSIFQIEWKLKMLDPNTTKVIAQVKDEQNSLSQNLNVLFTNNHFKQKSISTVEKFGKGLLKNAENYRLSEVRDSIIPAQKCAFISVKCKTQEKASAMLKNIFYVMNYIKGNDEVELNGNPFLEVTQWDVEKDSIAFDFCFPINEMESYPELPSNVSIKKTEERKALKTIFNGNYRISDRAWYQLRDYADYNNIAVTNLPTEIFFNDPHEGTNSLEWVAEVFMPIQ